MNEPDSLSIRNSQFPVSLVPMHVLLTRRIPSAVLSRLEAEHEVDLNTGASPMSPDDIVARLPGTHALICQLTEKITADVIAAGPDLRIIANVAAGYENIDIAAARARGIVVTNTPDVLSEATAEFTWGLILAAARRIAEGDRLVRRGAWTGWALDFMLGSELRGKQLGIIGFGRIGRAVAAKAPAFGMSVRWSSRRGADPADADGGRLGTPLSFDELLVSSDVISLHVPGGAGTRHLLDRKAFARMKRSAILVNTSRGSVLDEEGLAWALKERLIAGAALDVYEHEPAIHSALLAMDNVVLAPHLGSATRETRTAMSRLAVDNVLAVLAGAPPLTAV
jgi:glyoxylate reductase